jgi:cytochrome c biogenesis protein CcdA
MREHETQTAFLKRLIAYADGEASRQLHDRLANADRNSKRIGRALLVMVALFILSLAGLGYCADLLPQIFSNPTHIVTKSLSVLVLASLICQLEFFGYLLWHRLAVGRLQKECRRRILLLVEPQLRASLERSPSVDIGRESGSTLVTAPSSRLQDGSQDYDQENRTPVAS